MKLPDVRGFSRQSSCATIGEHAFLFSKRKAAASAVDSVDMETIFGDTFLRKNGAIDQATVAFTATPRHFTFTSAIESRKFYIPTGRIRKAKRTGKETEEKVPVLLHTATVTLSDGIRTFDFTATNRGMSIRDHRDNSRKDLAAVRRELERLLGDQASQPLADLEAVISLYNPPSSRR